MTVTAVTPRFVAGAPGVLFRAARPEPALRGVRLDACGFAGVAPRGAAWVPAFELGYRPQDALEWLAAPRRRSAVVTVESWDEYVRELGGFDGPGLLPHAVHAFFAQGGQRAHVVRIVPAAGDDGVATGRFPRAALRDRITGAAVTLRSRNPGAWGDRLWGELRTATAPLGVDLAASTPAALVLTPGTTVDPGALLVLHTDAGAALHTVAGVERRPRADGPGRHTAAVLGAPLARPLLAADLLQVTVVVGEEASDVDRTEVHVGVGLHPSHPRWLADVLALESRLVEPVAEWAASPLELGGLTNARTTPFTGGDDRYGAIEPDDVCAGVDALADVDDLGLVTAPDLYAPAPPPLAPVDEVRSLAGATFEPCEHPVQPALAAAPGALERLRLDPRNPLDLARIGDLHARLVELAERTRRFTVLLDVPPFVDDRAALRWRTPLSTAYAAAYHPWLLTRQPSGAGTMLLPPSAVAAGIIAARELAAGVHTGPANRLAQDVVGTIVPTGRAGHDELHRAGINVFLVERDGVRLTGARTLSGDRHWRQLSVRRLLTMLRLTLERELAWMVFEPNNPALHASVRHLVGSFLAGLWRNGALAGATEDEAFFVRCDDVTNPQPVLDAGMVVAEIGVAPVEPLEFLLVELRCGDAAVVVEVT